MTSAAHRLWRTPLRRKALLVEATVALMIARGLTLLPMRFHTRVCGHRQRETPPSLPPDQIETARRVASAVKRASEVVPVKAVCIEQTLAASVLLRLRGVPTTAYIGVHKDPAQRAADPRGHNAHAWLRAGDQVVIGGPDVSAYAPLATFA